MRPAGLSVQTIWVLGLAAALGGCAEAVGRVDGGGDGRAPAVCVVRQTRSCYTAVRGTLNVGLCHSGVQSCGSDRQWGTCEGEIVPAVTEICGNGLDDDCNGTVDDGCPGPGCGDLVCGPDETCMNCPGDCGVCNPACGDGMCNGSEDCTSCPGDCAQCPAVCAALPTCASCNLMTGCGWCLNMAKCLPGRATGAVTGDPIVQGCAGTQWVYNRPLGCGP